MRLAVLAALVGLSVHAPPDRSSVGEATIGGAGARFGAAGFSIGLAELGRTGALIALPPGPVDVHGARTEVARRPDVREWWMETERGVEHGVDLARRPDGAGPLVLRLAVDGAEATGRGTLALERGGERLALYQGLVVRDARGRVLPSAMAARDGDIEIEVDDVGARYPIVVDPLIIMDDGELVAMGAAAGEHAGRAVAISSDPFASRVAVAVGTPDEGTVQVYVRGTSGWTEEIELRGAVGFGTSVSLNSDGRSLLVGSPLEDGETGAAYLYRFDGTAWSPPQSFRTATASGGERFGAAVALDATGLQLVVGSPGATVGAIPGAGRIEAHANDGSGWSTAGSATLAGGGAARLGASVAITMNTVVAGAPDAAGGGAAVTCRIVGTTLSCTPIALPPSIRDGARFGASVAFAGPSDIAVGAPGLDDIGSAFVYLSGGTPILTGTLRPAGAVAGDHVGSALAWDRSAEILALGASDADGGAGKAWVFVRNRSSSEPWLEANEIMPTAGGGFGASVAVQGRPRAGAAGRLVVGAPDTDTGGSGAGSAYAYVLGPAPLGAPCGLGLECASTFCADGVCCGRDCGNDRRDCLACSVAAGAPADGVCERVMPTGPACRPSRGGCDPEEVCTGTSDTCPDDVVDPPGTTCRPAAGACDVEEICVGVDACPIDGFLSGTSCREATGACDVAEVCLGDAADCPPDGRLGAGVVCRASTAACDPAESCDGASSSCPADLACMPDAPTEPDAGAGADAGGPTPTAGCACRASHQGPPSIAGALLVLALLVRRR